MADEMKGIDKLRKLSSDVYASSLWMYLRLEREGDWGGRSNAIRLPNVLRGIAEKIEREHAEELAAAKRDLTDEAREVVERLREIDQKWIGVGLIYGAVSPDLDCCKGSDSHEFRDRLIDLIEHGGKQDVDVAALLAIAAKIEKDANSTIFDADPDGIENYYTSLLAFYANSIHKAVEGAPEPDIGREAAVDWVVQQGGLYVVRDYPKMDEFVATLANDLGVSEDVGCGDDLRDAVKAVIEEYRKTLVKIGCMLGYEDGELPPLPEVLLGELDKRLMPPGMAWPRFDDGTPVTEEDAPENAVAVVLALDGASYWVEYDVPDLPMWAAGERVRRANHEVLGADGEPIRKSETVYIDAGNADMALFGGPLVVKRIDGCEAMSDRIVFEVVSGCEGPCLLMDDLRIAGPKPWGGGHVEHRFSARQEDVRRQLDLLERRNSVKTMGGE